MASIVAAWPMVALGAVMRKSDEWVDIDPEQEYAQVTVRLWGKGVALRGRTSGAQIAASRQLMARSGQFILSRIDARNGAFGLVPPELDGALVSNDFPAFDLDMCRVLPAFLAWMSKTHEFVGLCQRASEGTTNRVRLKEERFLATEIPLPPLDEQRRIVARIEALAARIEQARGLRREAMAEAQALWRSALGRAFAPQRKGETVALEYACTAILDNLHSNPVYSESGVPCVRSPDVGWGTLNLASALRTSEEEYRRRTVRGEPMPGDIVLVREGGGTGKAALVEEGQRFSLGQRVMMLRPDRRNVLPQYFLYQVLSPAIYDEHIVPLSKGSASPHLNIAALRKFPFQLPSLQEQEQVVIGLDAVQQRTTALRQVQETAAAELDALLPSVLDKAFRGEL